MVSKTETPYPSSPTIGQMQKLGEMPGVGPGGMPAPGAPLPRLTRSASDEEFQARPRTFLNLAGISLHRHEKLFFPAAGQEAKLILE